MKFICACLRLRLLTVIFLSLPFAAPALNVCAICKKEITGSVYVGTDEITAEKFLICSNCMMLPHCFLCGRPVETNVATVLPDGRILCERDAKTVVLDVNEAKRICTEINDELNRTFSRFTIFPNNVSVDVIDRNDTFNIFHQTGFDFESPNLLGCIRPVENNTRYWMQLMTGQSPSGLRATCAHEFTHAWCGENVPPARRARIARDAEEGFCEMTAYLLMDAEHDEAQKAVILRNHYTRGQVFLFIEAEQRYGFDQILDWMKYGNTARLEPGKLEAIRDVTLPASPSAVVKTWHPAKKNPPTKTNEMVATAVPETGFRLEGIDWGQPPFAIINGHTFAVGETAKIKVGATNMTVICLAVEKSSARIRETESGTEYELHLP